MEAGSRNLLRTGWRYFPLAGWSEIMVCFVDAGDIARTGLELTGHHHTRWPGPRLFCFWLLLFPK